MTLLQSIRIAAAAATTTASGGDPNPSLDYPVLLDPDDLFPKLRPENPPPAAAPICRLSGWQIPDADAETMESTAKFVKKLKRKLLKPKPAAKEEVLELLKPFPVEKLGHLVGGDVVGTVSKACVDFELWEMLEAMISRGVVGISGTDGLIEKLAEKGRSDLICLYARKVGNLRSSDFVAMLVYFLSPPSKDSYESMKEMKKELERQGLLAIEKATQRRLSPKVSTLATEASVLLMMAHDGFSAPETCLHHLFSSPNHEGLVMSSAISGLDGQEVLGLMRYFRKWMEKYEKFPEAVPCYAAASLLGLKACEWVPSLGSVVRGLGLVLDEHFSYLILNPEFHAEMTSIERTVNSLSSKSSACCYLASAIENLPLDLRLH